MSQSTADCHYVPLNCSDNDNDNDTIIDISDFDLNDDTIDKFLMTYGKDSLLTKIIFSMLLMNPLTNLFVTGIIYNKQLI